MSSSLASVDRTVQVLKLVKEHPIKFCQYLWPEVKLYNKQLEIVESVRDNYVTVVPAANMMGKDFISAFICLWYYLTNWEVRIITTSVRDDHLRVLWGEIGRFIDTARKDTIFGPLSAKEGGPLLINHHDIKKRRSDGTIDRISYLRGMVSEKGEGMAGHHAGATLGVCDESSGLSDTVFTQMETWAKRILIIGNTLPCDNFFRRLVKEGDVLAPEE